MSQVFISYRQTDDAQKQCVRTFAERLRAADIGVVLDQFYLDDNPAAVAAPLRPTLIWTAAISAYREVVEHIRNSGDERDLTTSLNALAGAESASGNIDDAERDFAEALRIARPETTKTALRLTLIIFLMLRWNVRIGRKLRPLHERHCRGPKKSDEKI